MVYRSLSECIEAIGSGTCSKQLSLMAQDVINPCAQSEHITKASEQVEAMMQTFKGLLRLIEIDTGKRRAAFTSFGLSSLTNELVDSYEPVFVDVGRQLNISIISGIRLNGDVILFSQILNNLLKNSIEHGQARCNIWVRLQAYRDGALLQVGDDAPGIPVDNSE